MITVYSKNNCAYCVQAKNYLSSKNINFREINIEQDAEAREFIINQGLRTMPQIFMDGKIFVGKANRRFRRGSLYWLSPQTIAGN